MTLVLMNGMRTFHQRTIHQGTVHQGLFIKGLFIKRLFIKGLFIKRTVHHKDCSSKVYSSRGLFIKFWSHSSTTFINIYPRYFQRKIIWCIFKRQFFIFDKINFKHISNLKKIVMATRVVKSGTIGWQDRWWQSRYHRYIAATFLAVLSAIRYRNFY